MDTPELVFDNGGSLTIQSDRFVHTYDDMQQAARDYKLLIADDDDASDWDGNNPDDRIDYSDEDLRNGGYVVIADARDLDPDRHFGWRNVDDFQRAYFGAAYTAIDD